MLIRDNGAPDARAGVAGTRVIDEFVAMRGVPAVTGVDPCTDREYVRLFAGGAVDVRQCIAPRRFRLNIATCGKLASITRESAEVCFGVDAVTRWPRARG